MRNKVLYISIVLLIAVLNSGYSQKVSLILLPSGSTEIQTYDIDTEETAKQVKKGGIYSSEEDFQLTPQKNERRTRVKRSSVNRPKGAHDQKGSSPEANPKRPEINKQRLCKIIGSFCLKKWSKGLIRLYSLPSASGIKI